MTVEVTRSGLSPHARMAYESAVRPPTPLRPSASTARLPSSAPASATPHPQATPWPSAAPPQAGLGDPHEQWNWNARGETPSQRLDRNYSELLQEVRVAQTGVQLLLAFLLTLAFTPRFGSLTAFQRHVYVTSLVLGFAASALLIAPAPFHRVVYGRRLKRSLLRASNRFALAGLALLMLSLSAALLLILNVVLGARPAELVAGSLLGWFALWWYLAPMWLRARGRQAGAGELPRARHSRGRPTG